MVKKLPLVILGILLVYIMYWRWQVSQTRFFDVDEFSYLHWAANLAHGQRPYTDFFMFFTPGFLWFFAPLFVLFSHSASVFIAARVVSFGIFSGILVLLWFLFAKTRNRTWALLPVVLLAFLPMPFDKFLETRPDNLSTLLAIAGLVLEVYALSHKNNKFWFWSGFCYMASLVVFAKTLPFVAVGVLIALINTRKRITGELVVFIKGLCVPLGVFLLWVLTLGDIPKAWYSLTKLPFEANTFGKFTIMEPHLFFFPNGSFYGGSATVTIGLILNHAIWFIGIVTGVVRLFTPFIGGKGERKNVLIEVLISGVFLLSVIGYVQFFPLKHSQYLIPIAIFIAYYCADFLAVVFERMDSFVLIAFILIGSWVFASATISVNQVKLSWSNVAQLTQARLLISSIPTSAQVLDLEGRMVFWKDAYYICCVPFGSFTQYLTQPPIPVEQVLEAKNIPYIFQGDSNRLSILSSDAQRYIRSHYTPVKGWGETFWERGIQ